MNCFALLSFYKFRSLKTLSTFMEYRVFKQSFEGFWESEFFLSFSNKFRKVFINSRIKDKAGMHLLEFPD